MTATTIAGRKKIAEGREAEIFEWDAGAVIKLYRGAAWAQSAVIERAAMMAVHAHGGPAPAAGAILDVDGRPGLVMERVEGTDLLTQVGNRPWTILSASRTLGRAHAALHAAPAPPELRRLHEALPLHIEASPAIPDELKRKAIDALASLPRGDRLCHGDYHPGNVIVGGGRVVVIDWPAAVTGNPLADVARTRLLLTLGEPPPGTPPLVRILLGIGRKVLLSRYQAAYRSAAAYDEALVLRWMLPLAIARLAEEIPEERERTLTLISRM